MALFKINNSTFRVGTADLKRSITRDLKYDVVTEDGTRHTETRALYAVYTLTIGSIAQAEYDRLRSTLTTYDETVSVNLPDGQDTVSFDAIVDIGSDGIIFVESDGTLRWDGMILTFTSVTPLYKE